MPRSMMTTLDLSWPFPLQLAECPLLFLVKAIEERCNDFCHSPKARGVFVGVVYGQQRHEAMLTNKVSKKERSRNRHDVLSMNRTDDNNFEMSVYSRCLGFRRTDRRAPVWRVEESWQ